MNSLSKPLNSLDIIDHLDAQSASLVAVSSGDKSLSYAELKTQVIALSKWFKTEKINSVCIDLENTLDWVIIDLAAQHADIICTPVPQFFASEQREHLYSQVKPDLIFSHEANDLANNDLANSELDLPMLGCYISRLTQQALATSPFGTSKITFTSGTTGAPKGVCLSRDNQMLVASALASVIGIKSPKHLVLLPLATLLENVAGIYAPLISGGHIIIPSDVEKGFVGSKLSNVQALLACITQHKANSIILVPELLQVLVMSCKGGWQAPASLRFIAVGGAKVSPELIQQARSYGLPVYQGYGLSECASVVSLCASIDTPLNSVGKLLPHLKGKVENARLHVSGNAFLGYIADPQSWYPEWIDTGDIASLEHGHLYINGRAKNIIINSFGRNISPEWVESRIAATGLFSQIMVLGDNQRHLLAILCPASRGVTKSHIETALSKVNQSLPDYAQVLSHIVISNPLNESQGLVTANGRLKREQVQTYFADQIDQAYQLQTAI